MRWLCLWLCLWAAPAWADGIHVVREGETVETIAGDLGDPALAVAIRAQNGLGPADQPTPGTVLQLPDSAAVADCEPSYVLSASGAGNTLSVAGGRPKPLQELMPLPLGARVCSGADGFVRIHLAVVEPAGSHDAVLLLPGTCLRLAATHQLATGLTSHLRLDSGTAIVTDEARAGRVVVETADGVTVGEDGDFRVAVEETATRTEVLTASVASLAQGQEVVVPPGFGSRTRRGESPGDPVELPEPGAPQHPDDGAVLRTADFRWTEAPAALGYWVEIAEDGEFSQMVRRVRLPEEQWQPERLFLSTTASKRWYWRIVTFDRAGFEGLPSAVRAFALPEALRRTMIQADDAP